MPLLDVSDVLVDPDFADDMTVDRMVQTIGDDGLAVNVTTTEAFSGVVTADKGDVLERTPGGERIRGNILVVTQYPLRAGGSGNTADVVTYLGTRYTVSMVSDYSQYGAGFVEATCDLIPLAG